LTLPQPRIALFRNEEEIINDVVEHRRISASNPNDSHLSTSLSGSQRPEEVNVLILGRTGVGKTTWINAFGNYLTFPTLDEALGAEQLSWIIPFAFRTYNVNQEGEFTDVKDKVGFSSEGGEPKSERMGIDEHDGTSGVSATQRTNVTRVQIGNRLI